MYMLYEFKLSINNKTLSLQEMHYKIFGNVIDSSTISSLKILYHVIKHQAIVSHGIAACKLY